MVVVVVGGPPDLIWVAVMAAELTAGQAGHQTESLCRSLGGPACLAVAWLLYQTVNTRNYNFTTCREETGELRFFISCPAPGSIVWWPQHQPSWPIKPPASIWNEKEHIWCFNNDTCYCLMIKSTYSLLFSVSNQFQCNMTRSHQILPNEMIFLSEMQTDFYDIGKRGRLFRLIHIINKFISKNF